MAEERSYDVGAVHRDRETEIDRLAAQARLGWEREIAVLEERGLRDGMEILELGSGPGFVTELLLEHFPASTVTALDIDPSLVADARDRLARFGDRVSHIEAPAHATGLPADRFDAAYARLLYQHLPDAAAATAEAFRVLRPGGILAVYDVDDAMWGVTDPVVPGYAAIVERMAQAQAAMGGDRYVGRRLLGLLADAGFADGRLDAIPLNTAELGLEAFLPQIDPGRLERLVAAGVLTQSELDDLVARRAEFLAADRPFILVLILIASGTKPAP